MGKIDYKSDRERAYKCELLHYYEEFESKKWKFQGLEGVSNFYSYILIKKYQILAQMFCILQKWELL